MWVMGAGTLSLAVYVEKLRWPAMRESRGRGKVGSAVRRRVKAKEACLRVCGS
jgi:hypothetical protein